MGVDGEFMMEGGEGACEDRRFVDSDAHNLKLSHATYFRRPLFSEVSHLHISFRYAYGENKIHEYHKVR